MKRNLLFKTMLLLCALIVGSGNVWAQAVFEKISSTDDLVAGDKYIIVCEGQNVAMGTIDGTDTKPYHVPASVSISSGTITNPSSSVVILTLGGESGAWTFNSNLTDNYLSLHAYDNYLGELEEVTDNKTKWTISFSDGNATIRNVAYPKKKSNDSTVRRIEYNKSANSQRFACYASTQQAVQLYHLTSYKTTITVAEYATFSSSYATDFSSTGITAYTATDNETSVTLNEISTGKVPANTPVVLYKTGGGTIYVPVIASADAPAGTNDLRVSTGTDVENMFVLAKKNNKVGFYKWAGSSDLSAGKVYLLGQTTSSSRDFLGFDANTTTAIDNVVIKPIDDNAPMYNLAGQRVNKSYKGVVIVNGKKVVRK